MRPIRASLSAFLLFCARKGRNFQVHFSKFADVIELPRHDRQGAIRHYATRFASELEMRVTETPLQWFNFYPFWTPMHEPRADESAIKRAAE